MKKISILILGARVAMATISGAVAWDVRTTGSDNNGGGFVAGASGTDYSQQNSAQCAYTDLVIGATNTQLTSAGCPFSSASVGNLINVTGGTGFTTGRYQVVSVSSTTATMDRAVGTASSTGGTGNLGGSLATVATVVGAAVGGNTVYLQSGTYTQTTTVTQGVNLILIGFASTHTDLGTAPLITTATSSVDLWKDNCVALGVENVNFSNTAGTPAQGIRNGNSCPGTYLTLNRVSMSGFTHAFYIPATYSWFSNVEVKNSTQDGFYSDNNNYGSLWCNGCYFHNNSGHGYGFNSNMLVTFINSIISFNGASGIGYSNGSGDNSGSNTSNTYITAVNCDFVSNTGSGIFWGGNVAGSGAPILLVSNSIFYGNSAYGIDAITLWPGGTIVIGQNNAFGSNTSGNTQQAFPGVMSGTISLTADPFSNRSGGNFALNTTSGGGALLKGAGFPGTFPGGTTTGYLDVGAVQSSASGSGTPASAFVGN